LSGEGPEKEEKILAACNQCKEVKHEKKMTVAGVHVHTGKRSDRKVKGWEGNVKDIWNSTWQRTGRASGLKSIPNENKGIRVYRDLTLEKLWGIDHR